MLRFSNGEVDLAAMSDASRSIVSGFTLENWALTCKDCFLTTEQAFSAKYSA